MHDLQAILAPCEEIDVPQSSSEQQATDVCDGEVTATVQDIDCTKAADKPAEGDCSMWSAQDSDSGVRERTSEEDANCEESDTAYAADTAVITTDANSTPSSKKKSTSKLDGAVLTPKTPSSITKSPSVARPTKASLARAQCTTRATASPGSWRY